MRTGSIVLDVPAAAASLARPRPGASLPVPSLRPEEASGRGEGIGVLGPWR